MTEVEREEMIKALIWDATTAIYGYTQHFNDRQLRTMKFIIDDELAKRKESGAA